MQKTHDEQIQKLEEKLQTLMEETEKEKTYFMDYQTNSSFDWNKSSEEVRQENTKLEE